MQFLWQRSSVQFSTLTDSLVGGGGTWWMIQQRSSSSFCFVLFCFVLFCFLQEAPESSFALGKDVRSLLLSILHFLCRLRHSPHPPPRFPEGWFLRGCRGRKRVNESIRYCGRWYIQGLKETLNESETPGRPTPDPPPPRESGYIQWKFYSRVGFIPNIPNICGVKGSSRPDGPWRHLSLTALLWLQRCVVKVSARPDRPWRLLPLTALPWLQRCVVKGSARPDGPWRHLPLTALPWLQRCVPSLQYLSTLSLHRRRECSGRVVLYL